MFLWETDICTDVPIKGGVFSYSWMEFVANLCLARWEGGTGRRMCWGGRCGGGAFNLFLVVRRMNVLLLCNLLAVPS